ncbi:uncharacterized protein AB9W97_010145 [Spinachia spinachia]
MFDLVCRRTMEGEKETAEEKEDDSVDDLDVPIMQWEDLSQRIAELEKQEQERRERSKGEPWGRREESRGGAWSDVWEEAGVSNRRRRVAVVTSPFHNYRKLQLCFINSSDSEDEEGKGTKKVSMGTGRNGCYGTGLKQEVANDLRTLRDKLLAEQKDEEASAVLPGRNIWSVGSCRCVQCSSSWAWEHRFNRMCTL